MVVVAAELAAAARPTTGRAATARAAKTRFTTSPFIGDWPREQHDRRSRQPGYWYARRGGADVCLQRLGPASDQGENNHCGGTFTMLSVRSAPVRGSIASSRTRELPADGASG